MQHDSVFIPSTLIAKIRCRIAWAILHRLAQCVGASHCDNILAQACGKLESKW